MPIRRIAAIAVSLSEIARSGEVMDFYDTSPEGSKNKQILIQQESTILQSFKKLFPYFLDTFSKRHDRNTLLSQWTEGAIDRLKMASSINRTIDYDWVYTSNHLNAYLEELDNNYLRVIKRLLKSIRELAEFFDENESINQSKYLNNLLYSKDELFNFFFCTTSRAIKIQLESTSTILTRNLFKTDYDIIFSKLDKAHFQKLEPRNFHTLIKFHILDEVIKNKQVAYKVTRLGKLFIEKINDYYRNLVDLVHTIFDTEKISMEVFESTLDISLFTLSSLDMYRQPVQREDENRILFFCSKHKTVYVGIVTYFKHCSRTHGGVYCKEHDTQFILYKDFMAHYLSDHLQIDIIPSNIQSIYSILDKLDPVLNFSSYQKELIIRKIHALNPIFHSASRTFMRSVYKVIIAILYLQRDNSEMRKSRHLDLYSLDKIFNHCGVRTYDFKNLKKYLRSIDFNWTDLHYSYEEAYTYYSTLILNDEVILQRLQYHNINPESYSRLIHAMYSLLLSSDSKENISRLKASMIQFVLKSIHVFSEIIDRTLLSDTQKFSSMRIRRQDIISIINSSLSSYPNVSKVYLTRILSEKKSRRLKEFIYSMEEEFVILIRDKAIEPIVQSSMEQIGDDCA